MLFEVRFQVLMVASMKMGAFWDVVLCSLMHGLLITLMMAAVHAAETLIYLHEITQCYIPESCHLHVI
jgi:hypothetical protein